MKNLSQKQWILLVVFCQILALASVAAKREWIVNTGTVVYLRTAPVDPRDMFRGDYVQLQYEISQPDSSKFNVDWLKMNVGGKPKYRHIYLQLTPDQRGVAQLTGTSPKKPTGLFIKAQIDPQWNSWETNSFIKMGIEKYFVEQGSGLAMEEARGRGQEWQTPLEMEVAIGSDGTALIRGYRWSDMGIRLEILESANTATANNTSTNTEAQSNASDTNTTLRRSPKLRISVRNQSTQPLVFIDSSEHCAFVIAENQYQSPNGQSLNIINTPNRHCEKAVDWQEHTLAPQQVYAIDIDLTEPQWQVIIEGKTMELGMAENRWEGFRWIYQLPAAEIKARAARNDVWLSTLRTARFNAQGRID